MDYQILFVENYFSKVFDYSVLFEILFYFQILLTIFIIAYNCYLIIKSYERRNCLC